MLRGSQAELFVGWFASQREGKRQPHSPQVCLPGAGWTAQSSDEITLNTAAGSVTARHYVAAKGTSRVVILYWYQNSARAIASEWTAKMWVVVDALRSRHADTALVRISVVSVDGHDEAASHTAYRFAQDLYPLLSDYLLRHRAEVGKVDSEQ